MSQSVAVLGIQWGDEGKGKLVDVLAPKTHAVVRFQGGHNAGHTIWVNGKKTVLHILPSGVLHPGVSCVLGNGVVLSLQQLHAEVENMKQVGIDVIDRLKISESCSIILPYHQALDQAREQARGGDAIGTTGRGIGPAYEDKIARRGIRFGDLFEPTQLLAKLTVLADQHNFMLTQYYKQPAIDVDTVYQSLSELAVYFQSCPTDVTAYLTDCYQHEGRLLFEGAQGSALDIDHGTYPYVTSSNTTIGGVTSGCGIGPKQIDQIVGVVKAYTTRVGSGPMPTELQDHAGKTLAEIGAEKGATTGRDRRCGWLDIPALRPMMSINSVTSLGLMKLDVLDSFEEIKLCTAYQLGDEVRLTPPASAEQFSQCKPIYETLPGWQTSTRDIRDFDALPDNAKAYIARISSLLQCPVAFISTGPEREAHMFCQTIFAEPSASTLT